MSHAGHMAIEKINPERLAKPHGYAHAIAASGNKLVFTSGQVPLDVEGNLVGVGPDYAEQGYQAAGNLYTALAAAGAEAKDIARLTIYFVDPTEENLEKFYEGLGRASREAGAKATATTLIGVAVLGVPGAVVELEATAVLD